MTKYIVWLLININNNQLVTTVERFQTEGECRATLTQIKQTYSSIQCVPATIVILK